MGTVVRNFLGDITNERDVTQVIDAFLVASRKNPDRDPRDVTKKASLNVVVTA